MTDPTEVAVTRVAATIAMVAGLATAVFLAVSIGPMIAAAPYLNPAYALASAVFVFGMPMIVGIAGPRLRLGQLKRALGIYAVGFLVVVVAWIPATTSTPLPLGVAPWPLEVTALATVPAAIAWRASVAWAYLAVNSALIAPVRMFADGGGSVTAALQYSFFTIAFSAIFTLLALVAMKNGAAIDEATSQTRELAIRTATIAATDGEQARLDSLVHDAVMGTLFYASRGEPKLLPAVRMQAAKAITQLDEVRNAEHSPNGIDHAALTSRAAGWTSPSVRFAGAGARIMIWSYFATMLVLALWSIDHVDNIAPTLIGLALFAVACAAVSMDQSRVLSRGTSILVVTVWPIIALLISWQLAASVPGEARFEQWYFGAGTVSLFFIALRARLAWSWYGFVALSAVILAWGATTDAGITEALGLVAKQLPIMIVGTLFAIGLARTVATIEKISNETSALAARDAAIAAVTAERRRALARLDSFATPLLSRIAGGARLTASDRIEFGIAEAELRDAVRARSLSGEPIVRAARAARRRGVDVVLLDDSGTQAPSAADLSTILAMLTHALNEATTGRIVARLLPGDRIDAATLVIDDGDNSSYTAIARTPATTKEPAIAHAMTGSVTQTVD